MSRPILLITEPEGYAQEALDLLSELFELKFGPLSRSELLANISNVAGVLVRLGHRVDLEVLAKASALKLIASPTTGLNHIDLGAAKERHIEIISLKGETAFLDDIYATAEHCWGLILALLRHIPQAHQSVSHGHWNRDLFKGRELNGKTLGIIGCGRLGRKIATYGQAFGMRVVAYDPFVALCPDVEFMSLEDLACQSDVVSLHAAYDKETHHLLDKAFFDAMKPSALFINTARGEIVDEEALVDALRHKKIAGAALDVLCGENNMDQNGFSEYLKTSVGTLDNLIITPHVGGATYESMAKTEIFIAEKIMRFAKNNEEMFI